MFDRNFHPEVFNLSPITNQESTFNFTAMIYEKNENRSKSGTVMKSVLGCLHIGLSWVS